MERKNLPLPKDIADLLAATPEVSQSDLARLSKAGERMASDPSSMADVQKASFVNSIIGAMKDENLKQIDVAKKMKCSRQNLHRILREDARENFTIETMAEVATAVSRRVEVVVLKKNESLHIMRCVQNTAFKAVKPFSNLAHSMTSKVIPLPVPTLSLSGFKTVAPVRWAEMQVAGVA